MKISFLVIASEILEGKVQDINTLNLSRFLKLRNYTLEQVITVSDKEDQILGALQQLNSSELIVISGGLGPTLDDLTKDTLSKFINRPLTCTEESKSIARQNFLNRGRPFPEDHPYQLIPEGSRPLLNPQGYAPGLVFTHQNSTFISLPGVPREFKSMLELHLPTLLPQSNHFIFDYIVRTKGIGEEAIFKKLDPSLWQHLSTFGAVASLPYLYGVDITIRLSGKTPDELNNKIKGLEEFLSTHPLRNYIWHIGPESLEECIINRAKKQGIRFGFAESCTGGLCSDKITNINGSSSVFYGSVICYNSEIKTSLLKVNVETINQYDVVSEEVALQMAQGLRSLYPIDIAISLTGYAGPHDNEDKIPVGTLCLGISSSLGDYSQKFHFQGERQRLKEYFYQVAFFQLLETLEKLALR